MKFKFKDITILIYPIIALVIIWLWDMECRILPWWFWLIAIIFLLAWSFENKKKRDIKELLRK